MEARRRSQAKFRLLERMKAHFWHMFESGMVGPTASMGLTKLVQGELDRLLLERHDSDSVAPFSQLQLSLEALGGFSQSSRAEGGLSGSLKQASHGDVAGLAENLS
eukprot:5859495-Prymnesium_polylepis.1